MYLSLSLSAKCCRWNGSKRSAALRPRRTTARTRHVSSTGRRWRRGDRTERDPDGAVAAAERPHQRGPQRQRDAVHFKLLVSFLGSKTKIRPPYL